MGGADTSKTFEVDEALGDTGAVVKEVEISPVSFHITYEFPRTEVTEEVELEDGTIETYTEYDQAPWASGVRLKDGSLLKSLYGGPGTSGYVDDTSDTYVIGYAFDQVINVEEVDSVIFAKGAIENLETATEDDYYLVPLK